MEPLKIPRRSLFEKMALSINTQDEPMIFQRHPGLFDLEDRAAKTV